MRMMDGLRVIVMRATCPTAMYALMAGAYAGAEVHLWEKGALGPVVVVAYAVLALRH